MTIHEIEEACKAARTLDFSRHPLQTEKLTLTQLFYPYGFPAEVRTNSAEVLDVYDGMWGKFARQHDTKPILVEVHAVKSDSTECPPPPACNILLPLLTTIADPENYSIVDLERGYSCISISCAALRHKLYAGYFLLGTPATCISTRLATPVHAGCVAMNGRGVLLCGDSGAGKSTLSYACARRGWTYVADDASYLINGGAERMVTGDCYKVRFRPTAAELFPEIRRLKMTPRAAGKPSVEMPTTMMPNLTCAQNTRVDFMVFLKRGVTGKARLKVYRKDVARYYMRQVLFGLPETLEAQYDTIDRFLSVDVLEMRYNELGPAIECLSRLVAGD